MVFYRERAAGFCSDVGYQDGSYSNALVRMFEQGLEISPGFSAALLRREAVSPTKPPHGPSGELPPANYWPSSLSSSRIRDRRSLLPGVSTASGRASALPAAGWPTDTFVEGRRRKYHNNEGIDVVYEPIAITDGDSIVHFRRSDVSLPGRSLRPPNIRSSMSKTAAPYKAKSQR